MIKLINIITPNTNIHQQPKIRKWGFTQFSEKLNGRLAMIGFVLFYFVELLAKKNIFELLQSITIKN